jgi:hypothetical protein
MFIRSQKMIPASIIADGGALLIIRASGFRYIEDAYFATVKNITCDGYKIPFCRHCAIR